MPLETSRLKESLAGVKLRISSAAARSGRDPDDIVLVAVTKTVGVETLKSLSELGWPDIGENRVSVAVDKARLFPGNKFLWHMIGHLQSNKAKRAAGLFDYVHSLDSISLAEELQSG